MLTREIFNYFKTIFLVLHQSRRKGLKEKLNPQSARIVELLEKEFNFFECKDHSEIIKPFLLNDQIDIQSRFNVVLNLRHLIKDTIKRYSKDKNKNKIITDKIKIYVDLLLEVAQNETIDVMIRSDSVFALGKIGCIQYHEKFETNKDLIYKNLKKILQNENKEIIRNTIASIFWHFADTRCFPDNLIEDLEGLQKESSGTVKDHLRAALYTLSVEIDE